jgi:hypothetical protein
MARRRHRSRRSTVAGSFGSSLLTAFGLCPSALAVLAVLACWAAPLAHASATQQSIIEDDVQLRTNLVRTLATMRDLGASIVKVAVYWQTLAPRPTSPRAPAHFDPANPSAYPATGWAFYDDVVRQARLDGLQVGFTLTGPAPVWAEGPGIPAGHSPRIGNWKPSAAAFGAFVHAMGERYDGSYRPTKAAAQLPRVSWWSIWNEPNYGPDLAPQAIDGNSVDTAAIMYRSLLNAAWKGLTATGHQPSTDTILIGETAPRGIFRTGFPGNFSGTLPLRFVRDLYCVSGSAKPLRGAAAARSDCPTTAGAASQFSAQNPALFSASGYAVHPYEQGLPPIIPTYACGLQFCWNTATLRSDPNYADFPELGRLARLLDRLNAVYGSSTHFPLWNTEYGWWTNPPYVGRGGLPPQTAAAYMNWAEYLSYTNPRLKSYDQYLLRDPVTAVFASGLELPSGRHKATFDAFELPLYMPRTSAHTGSRLLVWGCVRPGPYALSSTGLTQKATIQFQPLSRGQFIDLATVAVKNPRGYFETSPVFTESGTVRLAWTSPGGTTIHSRNVTVTVHGH